MATAAAWHLALHEKAWGRLEKPCFAGNGAKPVLERLRHIHRAAALLIEANMTQTFYQAAGIRSLPGSAPAGAEQMQSWIGGIFRTISLWIERSKQRHALAELDDHLLHDVGLSRKSAHGEVTKPFWKP